MDVKKGLDGSWPMAFNIHNCCTTICRQSFLEMLEPAGEILRLSILVSVGGLMEAIRLCIQRVVDKVPYGGKLLREKTFANFMDLGAFVKVFSTIKGHKDSRFIAHAHILLHYTRLLVCLSQYPVCVESTKVFFVQSYISLIHESFLPRKFLALR